MREIDPLCGLRDGQLPVIRRQARKFSRHCFSSHRPPGYAVMIRPVSGLFARLRTGLSPESYFGLQITVGVLVLAAGAWLFGGIAEDVVTGGWVIAVDRGAG